MYIFLFVPEMIVVQSEKIKNVMFLQKLTIYVYLPLVVATLLNYSREPDTVGLLIF